MKQKITSQQRELIYQLLDKGENRETIAKSAGVSAGQVSALAAHRTIRQRNQQSGFSPKETSSEEMRLALGSNEFPNDKTAVDEHSIRLGANAETGQLVVWNPYASTNPHILILGESGVGKTYTASRLVVELARVHLPSVIFDYGQGFSLNEVPEMFREEFRTIQLQLNRDGIAINPLQIFPSDTHGPATVAQRVADTFLRVYPRLGVQQHAILRRAILELLSDAGILLDDPKSWRHAPPPFRDLEQKLLEYSKSKESSFRKAASSAASHVSTLFFFDTFRKAGHALSWAELLQHKSEVWILQLGGLEASVERAVTEFLLWSLIRHFELIGPGPLRCFVVLDEAHKLAFGPGSPVEKILREGRKFGLGAILASQQPEDFTSVAFANTATKIVFQVGDHSGQVARQLQRKTKNGHSLEYIAAALGTLARGSAYVVTSNAGCVTKMLSFQEELHAKK